MEESKKVLEELSKEELVKKCKGYLTIAQKAKQARDSLGEEVELLEGKVNARDEIIEGLTSQKLSLVTELEDAKNGRNLLEERLKESERKLGELDTENLCYRKQVNRLTDENEQLITHLDQLEQQIEELKRIGLEQQTQLLELEKNNGNVEELQKMLTISLEEIRKLKELNESDTQLSNLQAIIDALKSNEMKLLEQNEELKSTVADLSETLEFYQAEINSKNKEIETHAGKMDDLQTEIHMSRNLIEKLKRDVSNTSAKLNDNQIVSSGLNTDLQNTNEKLKERLKCYHGKMVKFAGDIKHLKETKEYILENFKLYNEQVKSWRQQLIVAVSKLKVEINSAEEQKTGLNAKLTELQIKFEGVEGENSECNKLIAQLKNAIERLENELETSKLAEQSGEELIKLSLENKKLLEKIEELKSSEGGETIVVSLKRENAELLREMNEMNQVLKERGETINKQEAYMDDLIKKISMYETQIEDLNRSFAELQERSEDDTLSTSTISKTEELNRLKDLEGSWEERYGKLRNLALKLKAKVKELTAELSEAQNGNFLAVQGQLDQKQDEIDKLLEVKANLTRELSESSKFKERLATTEEVLARNKLEIEALTKEKNSVDAFKKQVAVKLQSLKKELEANGVLKRDFEARIAKLTSDLELKDKQFRDEREKLENLRSECKKQSVLSLEIADYERSIKDLSSKLDKKNELVTKLRNQADGTKAATSALKEQARLNEAKSNELEEELQCAREEVTHFKKTISDLENRLVEKETAFYEHTKEFEALRADNEDLTAQLTKTLAENGKSLDGLKEEKELLHARKCHLEQRLRETEAALALKETELANLRSEYDGYKIRAQSVLRQNQTRDVGAEEKLNEEAAELRAQADTTQRNINELRLNIDALTLENSRLTTEKETLRTEKLELVNEAEECRREIEKLGNRYHQIVADHAETVRSLKLNAETLSQCYRQQISEQEVRHNREIIELQGKLEKGASATDVPTLAVPTTPREEGEGSESVDNANNGNPHPLERLLLGGDPDIETPLIRKQLSENEAKLVHLTSILADTEQDLAKHVQMNKVLKEEIRRHQRSVERERHAENLEYMKNVVFKFVTLGSGDERQRLVPVLNTILKLSPEETQKLNSVARGDRTGWTNYLPIWSGQK